MANTKITNPELFNLGDSTSATQLPVMTLAQRIAMNAPPTLTVDYLVVAGGAGGGVGGGGAGGYRTSYAGSGSERSGGDSNVENALTLQTETSCTVTVGAGGTGVVGNSTGQPSGSGNVSTFATVTSTGGGGGGTAGYSGWFNAGVSGGSGGGSHNNYAVGATTSAVQGFNGGLGIAEGGGGGGAGGVGGNEPSQDGGIGLYSSITGTSIGRAGGGGGFIAGTASEGGGAGGNPNASDATANTGAGGGGGINGGQGGSGVVILRYATSDVASYTTTGISPTEDTTTIPGQTILSFTTVGTSTITFTSSTPTSTISTGEMIFNSDTDKVEYWDGTKWYGITYFNPTPPALATSTVYLDASNNNSYPGAGSTWFDISGNSHNGAISGAQFNSQGWFDFDGLNDTISIPHSSVLNAQTFSVGGWFYPEYTGGRWLFTKGGPNDWEYGASATTGSSANIGFATWLSGGTQVGLTWADASVTTNTWYHVIVTVDRANVSAKLYVNGGAPKATDTSFTNHQTSSRPLLIGKRNDIGTYFDGRNSKFNFWSNQVLTQLEVQQLYDAGP
jgi:hypothetical protein